MNLEVGTDRHVDGEVGPTPGAGFRVYFDGRVDRVQQDERDQLSHSRADLLVLRSWSLRMRAARGPGGIRDSQPSHCARAAAATGSLLRSSQCQTLSSRRRAPASGAAATVKTDDPLLRLTRPSLLHRPDIMPAPARRNRRRSRTCRQEIWADGPATLSWRGTIP